jgi:lipopolysaccharide/colanic/teichoic acid biosynthesis glycosyltransferase
MDIILSLIALIVLTPILFIIALLVRIKIGKPIFFKQDRVGKNEVVFTLFKFRTMTETKDEKGFLLPDDKRLTQFGKFLRSTSLDELPELINIIKGDMSIVGPRPLLVKYLERYDENQRKRHSVLPGLTGLSQVNGRNLVSWEERFTHDITYVNNISFVLDVKIILKTIVQIIKRTGISSENSETHEEFMGLNERTNKNE